MENQQEIDSKKTKKDIINELRDYEGEIKAIDTKIDVIEGLMRDADGDSYDDYQRLINDLLNKRESLQLVLVQKEVELKKIDLKEAYVKANYSQVKTMASKSKREYDAIVSQIKGNSDLAEDFKREAMIYEGKKLDKHSEISEKQEMVENIKDKLVSLKDKKENFVKINKDYDLETVRNDIESYKTWIIENNGKNEIIDKYLKLKGINKDIKSELKADRATLANETKELKKELKATKAVEKSLSKEIKLDSQIAREEKRYAKKVALIEKLREEAVDYRERELYNDFMYQNMLGKNVQLRKEADNLKTRIEELDVATPKADKIATKTEEKELTQE